MNCFYSHKGNANWIEYSSYLTEFHHVRAPSAQGCLGHGSNLQPAHCVGIALVLPMRHQDILRCYVMDSRLSVLCFIKLYVNDVLGKYTVTNTDEL